MAKQIRFFKKNIIDLENTEVVIDITDAIATNNGQVFVDFIRNRKNDSAWLTTGSTDAANTQMDIHWTTGRDVTDILLVKHNFKAFTIQYWDGSSYVDFSTPIAETANVDDTSHFEFDSVATTKIRIIVTACQVVDDQKQIFQLIITEKVGAGILEGWPIIKNPIHDRNQRKTKMLSGKILVIESLGAFSTTLNVAVLKSAADLTIIETIYQKREGVLLWLSGGDQDQFDLAALGYRKEDIFLVRPVNSYGPEWVQGLYRAGLNISLQLQESVD